MKQRIAALAVLVGLLSLIVAAPISAATPQTTVQKNGAGGLVAAVVDVVTQVQAQNAQVGLVNLNNSLNNLTAVNNILNHNNVLDHNNVPVTVQNISILNGVQLTVLNNALNNLNIAIGQVIGVAVLSGGQIIALI